MKCPVCNSQMKEFLVNKVALDACNLGCGGVWFDHFELQKFDEAHEPTVDLPIEPKKSIQRNNSPLSCPRCSNIKLFQRFSSVKRKVAIDECAGCGGVWLDAGELSDIRNEFSTDAARKKAAEEMCTELFTKDFAKTREKTKREVQKSQTLSNALKFLCPSWYIPGKQKGGAF